MIDRIELGPIASAFVSGAAGVVIVGSGFGCRVHAPAARAAGLDVVALVGRDRERTARRAERAGIEVACVSLDEALRLPGSDIVIISTPPDTHAALAEQVLAAGRHVLVEKPFTTTVEEAERLVALAEHVGVVALVGHEFRFSVERVTLLHALRDGLVGQPRLATFVGHTALVASPEARMTPWWFDRARGGGWLGASVSHVIDSIRCWLGEFDSVSATLPMVSDRDPANHAEDTAASRFRMRSGCEGVLQQSAAVWGDSHQFVRVAGPLGALTVSGAAVVLADASGTRTLDPVGPPAVDPAVTQAEVLRDLAQGRAPDYTLVPPATFADGLACVRVMDAVRTSAAAAGTTVAVS